MTPYFSGSISGGSYIVGLGTVPSRANVKTLLGALRWLRPKDGTGKAIRGKIIERTDNMLVLDLGDCRTVTVRRRF
jgi:RNase P/RNase MRP subunit p29